ncbi:TonB-dependent siderophore receptor [Horticoccus sp. 23ND18S-11]|uniref:TonB-dependent siderophore receptor n=1 Tax=Horticoccus sp. 23ND18S-11 TaxID=3391832 RepID=UPI0039C8F4E5
MTPSPTAARALAHGMLSLVSAASLFGQAVPPPRPAEAAVVLSPFEVSTSSDVGYIATNSLAGSRLNASLKDTPAIIDVFTKEFLADIGATNLEQAMAYANNSQTDDGDTLRVNNGISQTAAGNAFNFRSRGILGNSTRNYFETRLGTDFYSTERLDDSRGPNSVLFGIGSAGGIINNSPKRAQFAQRFFETQLLPGTADAGRATLDVNVPIAPRIFAARLNALYDHKGSWREYLANTRRAATLALTYRPFDKTEVRLDAEKGNVRGTVGRNYPVVDGITRWWANGSPTVASTSTVALTAAQTAVGYSRPLTANRLVYVENQNFLLNANQAWSSAQDLPYAPSILNDPARVPYEANAAGPGGRTLHDFENITAIAEHRFTSALVGEVGFYHEKGTWLNYDVGGDNITIRGDPNGLLRNPTFFQSYSGFTPGRDAAGNLINPNAGGTYLETLWLRRYGSTKSNNVRATLAYEINGGRWGHHRMAAMGQHQVEDTLGYTERESWLGAPFNNEPTNDNNGVWRRSYITLGDSASQRLPDPLNPGTLTATIPGRAAPVTNGWVQNGGTKSKRTIDSQMIAVQSTFWQRRIVTTLGYRRDELSQSRTTAVRDTSGIWAGTAGIQVINGSSPTTNYTFSGSTTTAGIVVHPLSWVSLFANRSKNLGLPDFTQRLGADGGVPPAPQGNGFDTGVMVSLRQDRIVARVSYFTTDVTDQSGAMGVNNAFSPRYDQILSILDDPNGDSSTADRLYTAAQMAKYSSLRPTSLANGDSLDNANQGVEFRVTANVGESLRFIVNYSYNLQERANVYKRTTLQTDQLDLFVADLVKANPSVDVLNARGTQGVTLAELLATQRSDLDGRRLDFEGAYGNRKHKANFFVNYTFKDALFKGWSAGFGGRYLSPIVAGRVSTQPGLPPQGSGSNTGVGFNGGIKYGDDSLRFDGMLRYQLRSAVFGRNVRASFQLNVRNLLDDHDIEVRRHKTDGITLDRFTLTDPREITLSTTLRF